MQSELCIALGHGSRQYLTTYHRKYSLHLFSLFMQNVKLSNIRFIYSMNSLREI